MSILDAIILGIIQGLTEFLPVSSSGHLALAEFFGLEGGSNMAFSILLHLGSLLAVLIVMRRDILALFKKDRHWLLPLFITTAVTAAIAIPLKKVFEDSTKSGIMIAIGFIVTAILILAGELMYKKITNKKENVTIGMSIIIGIFQSITPFPGVSRSGTTISSGLFLGLKREQAVRYAFLLAIPAIIGAFIFDIVDISRLAWGWAPILGFLAAFISGYAALKILFRIVKTKYYLIFSAYTFIMAIVTLITLGFKS